MFHRILIMVSRYISSNFNYGNPYATFKLIMASHMLHRILIMVSPYVSRTLIMMSSYVSSNFDYGLPICYIQINCSEPICELNLNYGKLIYFIEF